jgi:predicted alpha/beta hydrolase family esterase
MRTIILPGYSLYNKEWAENIAKSLRHKAISKVTVIEWEHWQSGGGIKIKKELEKIISEIGEEKQVNIIAKSVGTMVAMELLKIAKGKINKIILCGVPSVSEERKKLFRTALSDFPSKNIIVFQNTKDPFATFSEVRAFIDGINPEIIVIEKPASDHNYPYSTDFQEFLVRE